MQNEHQSLQEEQLFQQTQEQHETDAMGSETLNSSQVSTVATDFGGLSGIAAPVNRRLFSTPSAKNKITSTPVVGSLRTVLASIGEENDDNIESRQTQKRRLDMFEKDFLYENKSYVDPIAKKMRVEEERDLDAIERILAARRHIHATGKTIQKNNVLYLQNLRDFKMRNLSYTVPQWPFLPLQQSNDNRIFVRFHSADYENRSLSDVTAKPTTGSFWGENKRKLWDEANNIILQRIQSREANQDVELVTENVESFDGSLWVEKYKPHKYIDLLSAEMTNRSLLFWLKMWDKIVFGKEFKPNHNSNFDVNKLNTFNKRTGKFESNGGWMQRRNRQALDTNTDEHGRPVQKVALLYGSPGLGKTTLAHILALHAGYQPLEINASDDRSPTFFQQALENGTQMTSVLNQNSRPNCIILDEIDGAPKQSIEFLVKFVNDNAQNKRPKKGGKLKKNILRRPIICICNDVYESALRTLRQTAFVVQFPPIETARIEERLKQIARHERLKTDISAIYALAEKTGNDVRSCISTMQFFKSEKKSLSLHDVMNSNIGKKDRHEGLFECWSKIFQIQRTSDKQDSHTNNDDSSTASGSYNEAARVRSVLDSVQSAGDYQRLLQGVYENFLNQKMPDPNLNGVTEALRWFCLYDSLQHQINRQQNYSIYPYLPFCFAKWHLLFASLAWPKITFPMKGFEFVQKTTAQRSTFESLRKGVQSGSGMVGLGCGRTILLEAISFLKHILSPEFRHLPVELFSQKEQQNLRHTVDIMTDLGLTYMQIKSLEGSYQFHMEPDLESLMQFPGSASIKLSYINRQILAREIEIERIHRAAPKVTGKESNVVVKENLEEQPKQIPNHLQKLQPKIPTKTLSYKSSHSGVSKFFANFVKDKSKSAISKDDDSSEEVPKSDPIVKSPIWYHYKEGFNNAVRKDVYIREIL